MKDFINWIITFTPKIDFISDIIAVQGGVIAIALPLSIDIISRISERYQSGVITKKFNQRWVIKLLPILSITDIIIGINLKFFVQNDLIDGYWKVLAWFTFVIFLISIGVLFLFFETLRRYITDTNFLLEELLKDMEESLSLPQRKKESGRKKLISKQKRLVEALEGTGDILVFDTKNRKRDREIEKGLNKIGDKIKQFIDIQKNRPEEFKILLLSEDYLNIHDKNPHDAQLLLAFDTEKHLITFTTAVNQLLRVRETALEVKNFKIGCFAIYHIIWLLKDICQIPNNALLVEELLKSLANIRRNNNERQDYSIYYASISWYISVVFKKDFDIFSYQHLLDRFFFSSIQYLVYEGQNRIFESMVSSLIDSGDIRYSNYTNISSYKNLLINLSEQKYIEFIQNNNIQLQIKAFDQNTHNVGTTRQLKDCLEALTNIEKLIEPYFDNHSKNEFKKIGNNIRECLKGIFKYKNLVNIMFSTGAYCVFKRKYDYINYLWNYNQPVDSDAIWVGHDIVPSSLDSLIDFYFGTSTYEKKFNLDWDNHHGSELYYNQYFLLLILREFQKNGTSEREQLINSFRFPDYWDSHSLSNINFSVDNLVEVARELEDKIDALKIIGFDTTRAVDDINSGLIPFLESLKLKVDLQLKRLIKSQTISPKKVDEFKQEFINSFTNATIARNIINFLGLYENRINDALTTQSFYGINRAINKEAFFEEWYSHWLNPGSEWGRGLARDEDSTIIDRIENHCQETDINQFNETLDSLKDNLQNVIIIAINSALNRFIKYNPNFTPKSSVNIAKILEVRGFKGWYRYDNYDIPVFEVYCNGHNKRILILDKSRLGKITQYSPIIDGDLENLTDIFYINVQAFSENEDLINSFLQNPPDWLAQKGNKIQKRDYLEEQVLIKIYEKFEFEKHQNFEGYLFRLIDNNASNVNDLV